MPRSAGGLRAAGIVSVAALIGIGLACAREGNAQGAASRTPVVADDTASVARLLAAVRGSDPLLCEMAVRNTDNNGWWSRWGSLGGNPLDVDSAAAVLISWIQRGHNDPAIVPRLRTAMRDGDACVRRVAGSFLGRIEHQAAVAALLDGLGDTNADTRFVAAVGLGLSEIPMPSAPLVRALRDQSPAVRRAAAWALGSREMKEAEEPLIDLMQRDGDPRVRQAAAWAIGRLYD
jgi:HEAT repeat protein